MSFFGNLTCSQFIVLQLYLLEASKDSSHKYIPGIDGLRAVAVLAVMLFHIKPSLIPGGFSGVDIFFVISGYVVSTSLARHPAPDFFRFAANFYARRILRIFPALIVCLAVSALAATLFIPASWLSYTSSITGLAAFFGLGNFALIFFDDGYFSPRTDFNPFTHTWSLGVEEQFYLVFPLIFYIWTARRAEKKAWTLLSQWLLAALFFLSLAYSSCQTEINHDAAFYLLPSRFWELASGALLFRLHDQQRCLPFSRIAAQLSLLAGAVLIAAGFILSSKRAFPFPWAMLSVFGTIGLIFGLRNQAEHRPLLRRFLESPSIGYIGNISYSLYLWHWPVYVLLRWTSGLETIREAVLAVAVTAVLSVCSYHLVEQRTRRNPVFRRQPGLRIIWVGIAAISAAFLLSGTVFFAQPLLSLSVTKDKRTWYPHPWPEQTSSAQTKPFVGRKIFAVGDSHAGAYSTMLQKVSDQYEAEFINMSAEGCGIANLLSPHLTEGKRCAAVWKDDYFPRIKAFAAPGDIVFFASLRMQRIGNQWATFDRNEVVREQNSDNALKKYQLARQETAELLQTLQELGLHVLIDAPKPIFASPPFRCSDPFNQNNPVCAAGFTTERSFLLAHRQPVMDSLHSLQAAFPELIVWDPFPILCSSDLCSAFDNTGKPLFFDGDHLSAHGNRLLYPSFIKLLQEIWRPGNNTPSS